MKAKTFLYLFLLACLGVFIYAGVVAYQGGLLNHYRIWVMLIVFIAVTGPILMVFYPWFCKMVAVAEAIDQNRADERFLRGK